MRHFILIYLSYRGSNQIIIYINCNRIKGSFDLELRVHKNIIIIEDPLETNMPYRRPIADLSETHRRPIADPSQTDMPDLRARYASLETHLKPTCPNILFQYI